MYWFSEKTYFQTTVFGAVNIIKINKYIGKLLIDPVDWK